MTSHAGPSQHGPGRQRRHRDRGSPHEHPLAETRQELHIIRGRYRGRLRRGPSQPLHPRRQLPRAGPPDIIDLDEGHAPLQALCPLSPPLSWRPHHHVARCQARGDRPRYRAAAPAQPSRCNSATRWYCDEASRRKVSVEARGDGGDSCCGLSLLQFESRMAGLSCDVVHSKPHPAVKQFRRFDLLCVLYLASR